MKGHHEADERQRIVHLLVRERAHESGAMEHLDAEDLAGLVAGTLLKTEIARVENHLMACETCRARSMAMQTDFEAGVVPILLRRTAPTESRGPLRGRQLPRRWTPWILGALATLGAIILSQTGLLPFGSGGSSAAELSYIFKRLGNPQLVRGGERADVPAEPGAWLDPGQKIEAAPGDYLEALRPDGAIWSLSEGKWQLRDAGSIFTKELFSRALEKRQVVAAQAYRLPQNAVTPQKSPRVIHPVGDILSQRPYLRWAGTAAGQEFEIRILDQNGKEGVKRRVKGYSLRWPDDKLPLEIGASYTIELRVRPFDGKASDTGRFTVVGEPRRRAIALKLDRIAAIVDRGPSILRAEYLTQERLFGEAREELERLRVNDSENVELLIGLKFVFHELKLFREEYRIATIIRKRR